MVKPAVQIVIGHEPSMGLKHLARRCRQIQDLDHKLIVARTNDGADLAARRRRFLVSSHCRLLKYNIRTESVIWV